MPRSSSSARSSGAATTTYASPWAAPIAARSDSDAASAFLPTASGPNESSTKWTPSTIASTVTALAARGSTTAASSPLGTRTRGPGAGMRALIAAIRSNSLLGTYDRLDRPTDQPGLTPPLGGAAGGAAGGVGVGLGLGDGAGFCPTPGAYAPWPLSLLSPLSPLLP